MSDVDPYRILGITPGAGEEEIKKAFRRLALRLHPDLHGGEKSYEARFRQVSEAYRRLLRQGWTPPRSSAAEDLLIRAARKSGRAIASLRRRLAVGKGFVFTLQINLEEGFSGCEKTVRLSRVEPCPDHGGPDCPNCGGRGEMLRQQILAIPVPAGIREKDRLRFLWNGGKGGAEISLRPHPFFRLTGDDLSTDIPVPLFLALGGGNIPIPTLSGTERITIDPLTRPTAVIRKPNQGYRRADNGRGDAVYNIWVELPSGCKKNPATLDDPDLYPAWRSYLTVLAKTSVPDASVPG